MNADPLRSPDLPVGQADRIAVSEAVRIDLARQLAAQVADPEIPVINLQELGILRDVQLQGDEIVVTLTPTYTGCPATEVIRDDVLQALRSGGIANARVQLSLAPPWTTDWITAEGRRKLREYGIAPPAPTRATHDEAVIRIVARKTASPGCPQCGSHQTERLSEHGSTPCKALYRCLACREPFDYFKPY